MLHARGALRRNAILEHASPVLGSGGQGRSGARGAWRWSAPPSAPANPGPQASPWQGDYGPQQTLELPIMILKGFRHGPAPAASGLSIRVSAIGDQIKGPGTFDPASLGAVTPNRRP